MKPFLFENYIAGGRQVPVKGAYLEMHDHGKGGRIGRVPRSTAEDVERALDAAWAAAIPWSRLEQDRRAAHLASLPAYSGKHLPSLALADSCGRAADAFVVNRRATYDVLAALAGPMNRLLAEIGDAGSLYPLRTGSPPSIFKLVLPAEAKVATMCRSIVPLLLRGHPVVSLVLYRNTYDLSARLLAPMALLASLLPPGVLNLITGLGLEAGLALERSPRAAHPTSPTPSFAGISPDCWQALSPGAGAERRPPLCRQR